jgi:hypothetical protein
MWGLNKDGTFISKPATLQNDFINSVKEQLGLEFENVYRSVMLDLQKVRSGLILELQRFQFSILRESDRGRRLFYLFQKDLMPGLHAMILESKGKRDFITDIQKVEPYQKTIAWLFIIGFNGSLLFYIYLFASRQSVIRQQAWFQTFVIWLALEIFAVSTIVVCVAHIAIPSLIMRDLQQVKKRLLVTISDYKTSVQKGEIGDLESVRSKTFNVADYFFISSRLASLYPSLAESKIISRFHSPWPHQSYKRTWSLSKSYSKRFSTLVRSASMVLVFLLKGLLSMPPAAQDMIISLSTVVTLGNLISIFVRLYDINPVLPFFPVMLIGAFISFFLRSMFRSDSAQEGMTRGNVNSDFNLKRRKNQIAVKRDSKNVSIESAVSVSSIETRRQSMADGIKVAHDVYSHVKSRSGVGLTSVSFITSDDSSGEVDLVAENKFDSSQAASSLNIVISSDSDEAQNEEDRIHFISSRGILSLTMSSDSDNRNIYDGLDAESIFGVRMSSSDSER